MRSSGHDNSADYRSITGIRRAEVGSRVSSVAKTASGSRTCSGASPGAGGASAIGQNGARPRQPRDVPELGGGQSPPTTLPGQGRAEVVTRASNGPRALALQRERAPRL